jgi:cytidylate kinase
MKEITITVTGPCNSGKSAIANLIRRVLQEQGIKAELEDLQSSQDATTTGLILQDLKDNLQVQIQEVSTQKEALSFTRIPFTTVRQLRDESGAMLMSCHAALVEAKGDFEKAKELLRTKHYDQLD